MRKIILLSAVFLHAALAAQWTEVSNTITTTDNVGIGTTSPTGKLDVNGNIKAKSHITVNKASSYRVTLNGDAHGYILGRNDNVEQKFQIHSNGDTWFNGGKVGIGTNSPNTKLSVRDGAISLTDGGMPFNFWAGVEGSNSHLRIGTDYGHYGDAALEVYQNYAGGSEQHPGKVVVNGNMGVGTRYPDAKLTVNGDIHTREVRVDLDGALAPDYVFAADYNLKCLEEVQNYISENGHLPNIPSAKEMEENGVLLKEMNLKLLEKIEELTLYTLEQEKAIQQLQEIQQQHEQLQLKVHAMETLLQELITPKTTTNHE